MMQLPRSTTWLYATQQYQRCSFCGVGIARYSIVTTRNEPIKVYHASACANIVCLARLYLLSCGVNDNNDAWCATARTGDIEDVCLALLVAPSLLIADVQRVTGADWRCIVVIVEHVRSCGEERQQDAIASTS